MVMGLIECSVDRVMASRFFSGAASAAFAGVCTFHRQDRRFCGGNVVKTTLIDGYHPLVIAIDETGTQSE